MIQEMWKTLKWPIKDGIYFADDRVVLLDVSMNWKTGPPTISSKALATVGLCEIKEFQENHKSQLGHNFKRVYPELNLCLHTGEGSNGSEGFVAVTEMGSGKLVWLAYFHSSNPFKEVELVDGSVLAISTHDHVWKIPLLKPDSLSVDCSKDIGWLVQHERQRRS